MKITQLDVTKYNRLFTFGCSFTTYIWPTWADILGKDIPIYENWAAPGAGNHYIFNSVIEANARHSFTKGDLVMIMWSQLPREDRYSNGKWLNVTIHRAEEVYGKEWALKYGSDTRNHAIRDFAYMNAIQVLLTSSDCDWGQMSLQPMFMPRKELCDIFKKNPENALVGFSRWNDRWVDLCNGKDIDFTMLEDGDVVECYKHVFRDIAGSYTSTYTKQLEKTRKIPDDPWVDFKRPDYHPAPLEALSFLERTWPVNTISDEAKKYAEEEHARIFTHPSTVMPDRGIIRL